MAVNFINGFDVKKQIHRVNELYYITQATSGVSQIEITNSDIGESISDYFVVGVFYFTIYSQNTVYTVWNSSFTKNTAQQKILINIDSTKGDNVMVMLQKAKQL